MIVYIYVFPDGKRYVGQTKNTPESRAGGLSASNYKTNPELYAAFEECGGYQNVPRYDIKVNTQEEADKIERTLITAFNPAYNRKAGNHSDEKALSFEIRQAKKKTENLLNEKKGQKTFTQSPYSCLSPLEEYLSLKIPNELIGAARRNYKTAYKSVLISTAKKILKMKIQGICVKEDIIYSKELLAEYFYETNINSMLKYGIITRVSRGKYKFTFLEEITLDEILQEV